MSKEITIVVEEPTDVAIITTALDELPREALFNGQLIVLELGIAIQLPEEHPEWAADGAVLRHIIQAINAEIGSVYITTTTFGDTVTVMFQRAS